jgi:hypothetical protein
MQACMQMRLLEETHMQMRVLQERGVDVCLKEA